MSGPAPTTAAAIPPATATATATATPAAPAAAGGTPPAPGGAGAPPAAAPASWFEGMNDDLKGYVGLKGWKDPASAIESYRNLEKLHGVPPERIVKLPESLYDEKGALTAEGRSIRERLGAPKAAGDYALEIPKEGGDPALSAAFAEFCHQRGLSKQDAQALNGWWNQMQADRVKGLTQEGLTKYNSDEIALKTEWGNAYEERVKIAQEGARRMGFDGDFIKAVAGSAGHLKTMKAFFDIGKGFGEGTFVNGQRQDPVHAPNEAATKIGELMRDRDFGERLQRGEAQAVALWTKLHQEKSAGRQINF